MFLLDDLNVTQMTAFYAMSRFEFHLLICMITSLGFCPSDALMINFLASVRVLFNDTVSSSDCIAPRARFVSE